MSSIVNSITGGVSGGSGAAGINYNASGADIQAPVTNDQYAAQLGNTNRALQQNDIVYNQAMSQNATGNLGGTFAQLQNITNGQGPNPAQAQLAQATAANTANQAALMAGQRGSSANTGLIARQAAMQGGANQQASAGQAATLQAQQSLSALGQQGQIAQNQIQNQQQAANADINAHQNQQQQLLNAIGQQNNANVGMQSNVNNANAGIANTVAGGQMQLIGNLAGGAGSAAMMMAGGGSVMPLPLAMADGGVPNQTAKGAQSNLGKFLNGTASSTPAGTVGAGANQLGQAVGKGIGSMFSSSSPSSQPATGGSSASDYTSTTGQGGSDSSDYKNLDAHDSQLEQDLAQGPQAMMADGGLMAIASKLAPMIQMMAAHGGKVPALVSPGERYLSPKDVEEVEHGADPMEKGKKIPGKAKVKGDKNSYANDTVPATLEEGGIVLPRSVTQAKHPHWEAHKFVSQIMAKQGKQLPKKSK